MRPSLRFHSPLIEPDVRISRIRLSDWLHLEAHDGRLPWSLRSRTTPSSPKMVASAKHLCRKVSFRRELRKVRQGLLESRDLDGCCARLVVWHFGGQERVIQLFHHHGHNGAE